MVPTGQDPATSDQDSMVAELPWKIACWAGDFMLVCPYRLLEQKISVMGLVSRDVVTGIISDKEIDHAPCGGRPPLTTGWPKGHAV